MNLDNSSKGRIERDARTGYNRVSACAIVEVRAVPHSLCGSPEPGSPGANHLNELIGSHFLFVITFRFGPAKNGSMMSLLRSEYIERIDEFLSSSPRYKLIILEDKGALQNQNAVLDVGRCLLPLLECNRHDKLSLPFKVQESLNALVISFTLNDIKLGKYLFLRNIGVLFEPSLSFNLTYFLKSISKNLITILLWPGVVRQDALFFLTESSPYLINYNEINYFIL